MLLIRSSVPDDGVPPRKGSRTRQSKPYATARPMGTSHHRLDVRLAWGTKLGRLDRFETRGKAAETTSTAVWGQDGPAQPRQRARLGGRILDTGSGSWKG